MNIEGKVLNVIFTVVYNLVKVIFKFVDILQAVFRAFAGVGPAKWDNVAINGGNASGNTGELKDTGIVYYLLQSDLVKNMLWSMMLLGIFLVIIFTVMAAIKNVYTSKPKKWQELIGKALLGLANFVVVPIVCMFGVWMGNILLDAVDGATTSGNSILMSRKLFLASAYNANVYRGVEDESEPVDVSIAEEIYIRAYNKKISLSGKSRAELANIVDECYTSAKVNDEGVYEGLLDLDNVAVVEIGYNLSQINYLTLVAGGVFMLWVLISVTYAMIRRIFLILILFIISPVMCAMYPWDDGKALGSWRGQFVPLVLSAYGAVAGMNLFFSVLPVVEKVRLPDTIPGGAFANNIVELIIIVTGLFVMKEFIGTISNLVGGEDALSKGTALRGQTTGAIKKYGAKAGKKAAGVTGAFRKASRAAKSGGGAGAFFGSLGGSIGKGLAGGGMNFLKEATGIDSKDFADAWKKGTEEGDKYMSNKHDKNSAKISEAKKKADLEEDRSNKYQFSKSRRQLIESELASQGYSINDKGQLVDNKSGALVTKPQEVSQIFQNAGIEAGGSIKSKSLRDALWEDLYAMAKGAGGAVDPKKEGALYEKSENQKVALAGAGLDSNEANAQAIMQYIDHAAKAAGFSLTQDELQAYARNVEIDSKGKMKVTGDYNEIKGLNFSVIQDKLKDLFKDIDKPDNAAYKRTFESIVDANADLAAKARKLVELFGGTEEEMKKILAGAAGTSNEGKKAAKYVKKYKDSTDSK